MNWIELSFKTTHEASDLLSEFLTAAGADGIQVQDASEIIAIILREDEFLRSGNAGTAITPA